MPMQIPIALTKTLTAALNELGSDIALIALKEDGFGPYVSASNRGFSPREAQAVLKALSVPEVGFDGAASNGEARPKAVRIRMTAPAHRSLLGIPLKLSRRVFGALVIGRKDIVSFNDKDRRHLAEAAGELETALAGSGMLALTAPASISRPSTSSTMPTPSGIAGTESGNAGIELLLAQIRLLIPYDRVLLTRYTPQATVVTTVLSHQPGRCEWRDGETLTLDGSAAGWMIRHKKPRLDRDLASTQGRFLDYKELYKDKFKTALGLPLRRGQEFIGTIVLGSQTPDVYHADMARAAAPHLDELASMLPTLGPRPGTAAPSDAHLAPQFSQSSSASPVADEDREVMIRQARQSAIREVTTFLEQEIQRPLTKTRMAMEEAMQASPSREDSAEGLLQRVGKASLDLTRIEAILNEVLDFAKPLDLHPRLVKVSEVLDNALTMIADDLEKNFLTVTRKFAESLPPIMADEGKLQQVFLSILKNALEAMTPHGHILLQVEPHKGVRGRHEVATTIHNDGAPIPTEHLGKMFEPGFTTKEAGTGLGLASVKKIIEEHHGLISITSGPDQGTAVIIRLPAAPSAARRRRGGRGRGRRGPQSA